MTRRSYEQLCPVAAALDVVGERWTLLIVRELLLGPQRFTDLQASLPGLGVSLLAQRLKQLAAVGVVSRERQPVGGSAYQLTDLGLGLGPVVRGLAQWGLGLLAAAPPEGPVRVELLALYLAASAPPATGPREVYQLRAAGSTAHLRIAGGAVRARRGAPPEPPDVDVDLDGPALVDLCLGGAGLADLVRAGRARVAGDPEATRRAAAVMDRTTPREPDPEGVHHV